MTTVSETPKVIPTPAPSADAPVTRLQATVHGRVQGVGFRFYVHHTVGNYHGAVKGSVHNTAEGAVAVEAESADRALLEKLLDELHHGPSTGHVERVDAIWETDVAPRHTGAFEVG